MTFVPKRYSAFMTPRENVGTYTAEIDVSDRVFIGGIGAIKRTIDSTDFGIGVYRFGDIVLRGNNSDGRFSEPHDSRTIFKFSRNLAKVRIVFEDESGDTITFRGLINDESSRVDPNTDKINFRVLSRDSVIRNGTIPPGAINDGQPVSEAFAQILNRSPITDVLNFSAANINPDLEFDIDIGTVFDNENNLDRLNELLFASNSVMVVDSADNIIIKSRDEDVVEPILNLFGKGDIHGRENIVKIKNYNTGFHRMFTSFKVNDVEVSDKELGDEFGFRQKKIDFDWLTNSATILLIANRMLDTFKAPKRELEVDVKTSLVLSSDLLHRVSLNIPLSAFPPPGKRLPMIGEAQIGDAETPLPFTQGSISIDPRILFKIIEISENPKTFLSTLKVRETGTELMDGIT